MSDFENVTVAREANVYFDGNVTSRTIILPDGARKTLGVMLPGTYEFDTAAAEVMDFSSGHLDVLLPGAETWLSINEPQSVEIPANASFRLKVHSITNYCCSYLD